MSAVSNLREHWLGFLIGGLATALVLGVFNALGTMGRLETKQDELAGRLDRIAAALPDMSIRVAGEELRRPLKGALVVAEPVKTATGRWVSPVHFLTSSNQQLESFWIPASGPDDHTAGYITSGIVVSVDKNAMSMKEASAYSSMAKDPVAVPEAIVGENSFLLYKSVEEIREALTAAMKKVPSVATGTEDFKTDVKTWKQLSLELETNHGKYTAAASVPDQQIHQP